MSAELLRRAADRIEDLANAATHGPWLIEYDYLGQTPQALFVEAAEDDPDAYDGTRGIGGFDAPGDNVWAGLVSPHIAAPLAAWLRAEADCQEAIGVAQQHLPELIGAIEENRTRKPAPRHELRVSISTVDKALAFARALLGEDPAVADVSTGGSQESDTEEAESPGGAT